MENVYSQAQVLADNSNTQIQNMTADEIQAKLESYENEIMQLETQIGKLETDITSCDNKIASKESLLSRTKSSSMQKTYSNIILNEKKRRLQKCKKRNALKRRLNEKKRELINAQRLIPDKEDNTNNNLIMETIQHHLVITMMIRVFWIRNITVCPGRRYNRYIQIW